MKTIKTSKLSLENGKFEGGFSFLTTKRNISNKFQKHTKWNFKKKYSDGGLCSFGRNRNAGNT